MRKNIDLIVKKVEGGYCLQCTKNADNAPLFYATAPYAKSVHPLGPFKGTEMWIPSPDSQSRIYFMVKGTDSSEYWGADTAVEINSIENFRDYGGYFTAQGTTVKLGRFFRCGAVTGMNDMEWAIYKNMHIKSIFDYRAVDEASHMPDQYTEETTHHLVPALEANETNSQFTDMDMVTQLKKIKNEKDAEDIYQVFTGLYARLPFGNEAYSQMLNSLNDEKNVPMIQHCSAGKDRTGVGCALVLLALGVDEETVMEDYLLSAMFRETANAAYVAQMAKSGLTSHAVDAIAKMMTVSRDLLEITYHAILSKYNSYEDFFYGEYQITKEQLQHWRKIHTV